ncbi:hypothetical protein SAMN05518855_1003116 [Paenibacillus sp. CF384]|nr:hypothetical protein SAMN05518855_1003116 [Paenibacillus sp. CF384]
MMRKWISIFAIAAAFLLTSTQVSAAALSFKIAPSEQHASKLEQQVQAWVDALSDQPQFQSWKRATAAIVPLGPGTHGWLVTFRLDRLPVGYMIVHATAEGGFVLGEYGTGMHPAFDANTLYSSMVRQGLFTTYAEAIKKPLHLERLYVSPVLAVWKYVAANQETYYLDAWTGEALPITDQLWQEQTKALVANVDKPALSMAKTTTAVQLKKLSAAAANQVFDPYERLPWLTKSPLSQEQIKHLPDLLDKRNQIRFTAELFRETVLFVYPAIGYHNWDNHSLFVAFDSVGTRYIPIDLLNQEGHFFD